MNHLHKYYKVKNGCWEWLGWSERGYGRLERKGRLIFAHRFFYEELKAKIPEGLVIDHLCRNTICVNPDHLEAVTQAENLRRAWVFRLRKKCIHGHEFNEENTYIVTDKKTGKKWRNCRKCKKQANIEWCLRKRE